MAPGVVEREERSENCGMAQPNGTKLTPKEELEELSGPQSFDSNRNAPSTISKAYGRSPNSRNGQQSLALRVPGQTIPAHKAARQWLGPGPPGFVDIENVDETKLQGSWFPHNFFVSKPAD
jgi:hypothetical protein